MTHATPFTSIDGCTITGGICESVTSIPSMPLLSNSTEEEFEVELSDVFGDVSTLLLVQVESSLIASLPPSFVVSAVQEPLSESESGEPLFST